MQYKQLIIQKSNRETDPDKLKDMLADVDVLDECVFAYIDHREYRVVGFYDVQGTPDMGQRVVTALDEVK